MAKKVASAANAVVASKPKKAAAAKKRAASTTGPKQPRPNKSATEGIKKAAPKTRRVPTAGVSPAKKSANPKGTSDVKPTETVRQQPSAKKTSPVVKRAEPDRFDSKEKAAIRKVLRARRAALTSEHERTMTELYELQADRTTESSGDDQADTGAKSFEREQELAMANGILDRINQVEHALSRLDNGTYGQCERCGDLIPKARLEAFPAATLCVTCKQIEERR